ncbi:MAG: hypothetical protein IPG75_15245 [Gemmatimonadetes bacterium]|nr:hypothetical protein [Gemmatimonadota bacterium]
MGTLGGANAWASDINNAGTAVGWSDTPQGTMRGFRWTSKSGMVALPLLPSHQWSRADQITPAGTILGVSDTTGGSGQPVTWNALVCPRDSRYRTRRAVPTAGSRPSLTSGKQPVEPATAISQPKGSSGAGRRACST